jgi:hypothetical protein
VLDLLASGLAFYVDLTLPSLPSDYRALDIFRSVVLTWAVYDRPRMFQIPFIAFGCTILAFTPSTLRWMKRNLDDAKQLGWLLPAGMIPPFLSLFGAYDHGRIAAAGMPVFCAFFAAQLILQPWLRRVLTVPAMIITFVYWDVLGEVAASTAGYRRYFFGWSVASKWDAALIVAAFLVSMLGQRLQAQPTRSGQD